MTTKKDIKTTLINHLPLGAYEAHQQSNIAHEINADSAVIATCFVYAEKAYQTITAIPVELLDEYERSYGLPLACGQSNIGNDDASRLEEIERVKRHGHVKLNMSGLLSLFAKYNQTVVSVVNRNPLQCVHSCTSAVNTPRLRFKPRITLKKPITVNMDCLKRNYLPAALMLDIFEQD